MTIVKVKDDFSTMKDKICLTTPVKNEKYYTSEVLLDGGLFQFQTSRVKLSNDSQEPSILFNIKDNGSFILFLDALRLELIDYLYDNSKKLFNDKQFSNERLCKSVPILYTIKEDIVSVEVTQGINEYSDIETFNHRNEKVDLDSKNRKKELVMIVQFKEVLYNKTVIIPKFTISYIKVPIQKGRVEKRDVPIFLIDSDEETSEETSDETMEEVNDTMEIEDPLDTGMDIKAPEELNALEEFFNDT